MKRILLIGLMLSLLIPALCRADGPVLQVDLPEGAQMVEDVRFEDGDFIKTYHLEGGATVQLLRYAAFDMTLPELAEGEWSGYRDARDIDLAALEGAQGMRFVCKQEDESYDVTLVLVPCEGQMLLFQAIYPQQTGGQAAIDEAVQAMLDSLSLLESEPTDEPVVG